MLYVRGDIHGEPISAFSYSSRPEMRDLTDNDYVVILGDWGVVWNDDHKGDTIYKLKWMANKPWIWVCLLGNHDNWDWALSLPKVQTEIGEVRECIYESVVYDNIYIVADPSVLDICGEKCFCIPGAECHDVPGVYVDPQGNEHSPLPIKGKDGEWYYVDGSPIEMQGYAFHPSYYRKEGSSWWKDEAVDVDSAGEILHYLTDNECHIDFIFSHDAPAIQLEKMNKTLPSGHKEPVTEGEKFLERVREELDFDCWFHGHLHWDRLQPETDDRIMCLYQTMCNLSCGTVV